MKTKEEILEGHFGSDYWMNTSLQYILRAMDEDASVDSRNNIAYLI